MNNKGADHPAHPCRLISAFVIRFLDSIMTIFATSKIVNFPLVVIARRWFESRFA